MVLRLALRQEKLSKANFLQWIRNISVISNFSSFLGECTLEGYHQHPVTEDDFDKMPYCFSGAHP